VLLEYTSSNIMQQVASLQCQIRTKEF